MFIEIEKMNAKSRLVNLLIKLAPNLYKLLHFRKLIGLSRTNLLHRNVEPELLILKDLIPPDGVFLDVGANTGPYVFALEKYLNPKNIHAFEPNRDLFDRLRKIFRGVNLNSVALSNEDGELEFKVPIIAGNIVHTRGTLNTSYREQGEDNLLLQKVTVRKLDSLNLGLERIDLIKIDVEGNEFKTLQGAKCLIQKHRPVLIVEIEQRHHATPIWDFILEIESWGYSPGYLNRQSLEIQPLKQELIVSQSTLDLINRTEYINNIIFLPKGGKAIH